MVDASITRIAIGLFVSLGASFMDALGLNILKLDHVKDSKKPERRSDCKRPLWHLGLYTYIASQVIGSTIALNYLKTQWVAPLGSVALIFNFLFAKLLVNTKITRKDVLGTCVVVASVVWIVVFGGMYNGDDPEEAISLDSLKVLFVRPVFIIYFSILNFVAFGGLILSLWSKWSLTDENRRRKSQVFANMDQKKVAQMVGLMFSIEGGVLASETLLLAKTTSSSQILSFSVKLFTLSIESQVNQFNDNASRLILLALVVTAVLQVYCLNTALRLYTSVVVVPVFYGTYTALGLVNTIIYLDEISNYPVWAIFLVFAGISVLIYGVYLLSSKPEPAPATTCHMTTEEELVIGTHAKDSDEDLTHHFKQQQQQHIQSSPTASTDDVIVLTKRSHNNNPSCQQEEKQQMASAVASSSKATKIVTNISKSSNTYHPMFVVDDAATVIDDDPHNNQQSYYFDSNETMMQKKRHHNNNIVRFLKRLKYLAFAPKHPHGERLSVSREMNTFLSLHSSTSGSSSTNNNNSALLLPTVNTATTLASSQAILEVDEDMLTTIQITPAKV